MRLGGTAFFLGHQVGPPVPWGTPAYGWGATVTARHVIDGINRFSDDGKVYLRLNDRGTSTSSLLESDVGDWILHPGGVTVDVAALPWFPSLEQFDHLVYTMDQVVTDEVLREEKISVGDEVFLSGLFVNHPGAQRNIPIIRIGNIAALPEEPVASKVGKIEAYLVEARSIGGLSGSPVFVNLGAVRETPSRPPITLHRVAIYLLGLMHGHWDVHLADPTIEAVNMGVAIVPPISKVMELLTDHQEFKDMRQHAEENAVRENLPTLDSEGGTSGPSLDIARDDSEFVRFEDLARKLLSVPKSEVDEKRKKT